MGQTALSKSLLVKLRPWGGGRSILGARRRTGSCEHQDRKKAARINIGRDIGSEPLQALGDFSRSGAVGDTIAAECAEPQRLADLHRAGGIVELRQAGLLHQRSDLESLWIQSHRCPAMGSGEALRIEELSSHENRAIGCPAQIVRVEIDLDTRSLAFTRQGHAIDFPGTVGVDV